MAREIHMLKDLQVHKVIKCLKMEKIIRHTTLIGRKLVKMIKILPL